MVYGLYLDISCRQLGVSGNVRRESGGQERDNYKSCLFHKTVNILLLLIAEISLVQGHRAQLKLAASFIFRRRSFHVEYASALRRHTFRCPCQSSRLSKMKLLTIRTHRCVRTGSKRARWIISAAGQYAFVIGLLIAAWMIRKNSVKSHQRSSRVASCGTKLEVVV